MTMRSMKKFEKKFKNFSKQMKMKHDILKPIKHNKSRIKREIYIKKIER